MCVCWSDTRPDGVGVVCVCARARACVRAVCVCVRVRVFARVYVRTPLKYNWVIPHALGLFYTRSLLHVHYVK